MYSSFFLSVENHSKAKMDVVIRSLYCYECSLQFDTKYVFNFHLSVVHGKELEIKQESDSQASIIPKDKQNEIRHSDEENSLKSESKIRKVSINTVSCHEQKEHFKCDSCFANFNQKRHLKNHLATVHEGKKQFKCDICKANFGRKDSLYGHVTTVHEGKKQFKCDIYDSSFGLWTVHFVTTCCNSS